MRARIPFLIGLLALAGAAAARAASPDDPGARVPGSRYDPITTGTKSYRPVEPLPWGEINRRVMPKDAQPTPDTAPLAPGDDKAAPRTQTPQHKN